MSNQYDKDLEFLRRFWWIDIGSSYLQARGEDIVHQMAKELHAYLSAVHEQYAVEHREKNNDHRALIGDWTEGTE